MAVSTPSPCNKYGENLFVKKIRLKQLRYRIKYYFCIGFEKHSGKKLSAPLSLIRKKQSKYIYTS